MRVASEIILELSIEQGSTGPQWPHPWDHYPFLRGGKCVWIRYEDLDCAQREQIRRAMIHVGSRLVQKTTAQPDS